MPPGSPVEGEVHGVGTGATGAWAGQDGSIAVFLNGGWAFLAPATGWMGWSETGGTRIAFDGQDWVEGAGSFSSNGAGFVHRTVEYDHAVSSGASSSVAGALPANAIVYGVTGRITTAIGGAPSLEIGVSGSTNRYGSGIGTGVGSWLRGMTGSPLAYYTATDLVLTAESGTFDGTGVCRLAVHYAELTLPRS